MGHVTGITALHTCRFQAQTVATAAAAVAGFNEIDLAFARYKANADGKRLIFFYFTGCQSK